MKKINIFTVIALFLSVSCFQNAHAALVNGSTLSFTAALGGHNSTDTTQPATGTGSWWAFPDLSLYLAIESFNGLIVGTSQSASGSHSGAPDGTESPAIDKAWQAFGSTGMLETTSLTNVVSATGNTATLDFSGIAVDFNGFDALPIFEPLADDTGFATVICAVDCSLGDTYTLDYFGHTSVTDPSSGGVPFLIHLEGTITAVPIPATIWLFGSGLIGLISLTRRKV